jgi:flagellar protein FliO/FliZ
MTTSPTVTRFYALAASLTALVLATPAFAADVPEDKTPLNLPTGEQADQAATSGGGGGGGIVRMVVGLAVVIGVIYGISWVMRQVKASKEGQASGAGLASLSSLPLGPNRSVHLVRVGTDLVLLGAGEKGVTPIRTYREDEARAAGLLVDDDEVEAPGATKPSTNGSRLNGGRTNGSRPNLVETLRKATVRR